MVTLRWFTALTLASATSTTAGNTITVAVAVAVRRAVHGLYSFAAGVALVAVIQPLGQRVVDQRRLRARARSSWWWWWEGHAGAMEITYDAIGMRAVWEQRGRYGRYEVWVGTTIKSYSRLLYCTVKVKQ